jgi:hypothetical protein
VLREPKASSTQETQLLYGHCAEVLGTDGLWLNVRGPDGYDGWMHEGYTAPSELDKFIKWAWDIESEISMGRALDMAHRRATFPPTADAIVASATALFQGTYYQWGGVTPWGADCSGMLQSIFALHGIHLLRDAWQQATQGVAVDCSLEDARPADLLFFSDREDGHITHIAMAIGGSRAVHIALGRGGHCLESFSQPDDYTRALAGRFRFARRIVA